MIDSSDDKNQLARLRNNVDVDMYYTGEKVGGLGDTFNSEFFLVLFYKYYNFFFLTKQN